MKRSTACLFILCLFASCSQMRFIGIETFNPAEITYPESVRTVLIVNNAVPQPPENGYEYTLLGVRQDTCKAHADSALFEACRVLGETIFETDFFYDVILFNESTRKDDAYLSDVKLTQEQVKELCDETGADAIISFDRLLFNMNKEVFNFPDGYCYGSIKVEVKGVLRSYLPSREIPQATALIEDSVFWGEEAEHIQILNSFILPSPDEALRIAGGYIGNKAHAIFVPHWDRENRWFYTGMGSRWKEASTYATNNKWEEASERWTRIHESSSGWKSKAKSASNLALVNELNGDLEKALEWATKAHELYEKNAGKENKYTYVQLVYKDALVNRILSDKKLNTQIRQE